MPHTPDRPVDIAVLFPDLAGQERPTVRLHPRRERPGPRDSSIGGPLLWPAAAPWPTATPPRRTPTDPAIYEIIGRDLADSGYRPPAPQS